MKVSDNRRWNALLLIAGICAFAVYGYGLWRILYGDRGSRWLDASLTEYFLQFSNLIPFHTIYDYITKIMNGSGNPVIVIRNLLGNLVMLLPMGLFLPFFFPKERNGKIFGITMFLMILTIECSQILLRNGSFDVDDFILGLAGAFLGFWIWNAKWFQRILDRTTGYA